MVISNIKLPVDHTVADLQNEIEKKSGGKVSDYKIVKKSIDARKSNVQFVYNIEVPFGNQTLKENRLFIPCAKLKEKPIVIGTGPAGLFAGYVLARAGLNPLLFERGSNVDKRTNKINVFFEKSVLDTETNVQFGEGGAGTFSDGKLTTQISNPHCREVLHVFCECGAPDEIMYLAKPHIGTDKLRNVIKKLRNKIIDLGGEFKFNTQVTEIIFENGKVKKIIADKEYYSDNVILAIGHSARDTFSMLYGKGVEMISKPFSVGARIEHLQNELDICQYGKYAGNEALGAADYKASAHLPSGRGVYTFCMCPGGVVVAATSEKNGVVTNGMSFHSRNGVNSNSALLVSVGPKDFQSEHPLAGIDFQRNLEKKAFEAGKESFRAPAQTVADFLKNTPTVGFGKISPTYRPGTVGANLWKVLPDYVCASMAEGIEIISNKVKVFSDKEAVLTGVETRSSSPVRILRNEFLESNFKGLYPCGEGAGYAGGIMSAAVDGIRCALAVVERSKK